MSKTKNRGETTYCMAMLATLALRARSRRTKPSICGRWYWTRIPSGSALSKQMKLLSLALAAAIACSGDAAAQAWPTRPITLIVPFAPGGGIDGSARIQAQQMAEFLGQPIVVENIGAAAGMVGSARVAKAEPDGYTFLIGNTGTHAYNQALYKKPLYHPANDFTPVGLATESPRILLARKDLP